MREDGLNKRVVDDYGKATGRKKLKYREKEKEREGEVEVK